MILRKAVTEEEAATPADPKVIEGEVAGNDTPSNQAKTSTKEDSRA